MMSDEVVSLLARLCADVRELKVTQSRMLHDHRRRVSLLDELAVENRRRNDALDRMIRNESGDDWWQRGEQPPWQI